MLGDESVGKPINICMLGKFYIEYEGNRLTEEDGCGKQIWLLLQFLIAYRKTDVPCDKLIDILWQEKEIENPANALKNLVYRLRNMLTKVGRTKEREYISFKRGMYGWNNELLCNIDTEQFEKYFTAGISAAIDEEKIINFSQAIDIYKGDFLGEFAYENWVAPICAYYKGMFAEGVIGACTIFLQGNQYAQIEKLCTKAIAIDPFKEYTHIMKMRVLVATSRYSEALAHYQYVTTLFYNELGVPPSIEIRKMYKIITENCNAVEADIEALQMILSENAATGGAYICDYEVFKNIYRVEARTAKRGKRPVSVGIFTVTSKNRGELCRENRLTAMSALQKAIMQNLRQGDVISRFGASQFVALLPLLEESNSSIVEKRVKAAFYEEYKGTHAVIHCVIGYMKPYLQ